MAIIIAAFTLFLSIRDGVLGPQDRERWYALKYIPQLSWYWWVVIGVFGLLLLALEGAYRAHKGENWKLLKKHKEKIGEIKREYQQKEIQDNLRELVSAKQTGKQPPVSEDAVTISEKVSPDNTGDHLIDGYKTKIERQEEEMREMGIRLFNKDDETDGLKLQIERLNSKYGWLSEIAEKERKALSKYVLVENCTVSPHLDSEELPYLIFDFNVINNSVYTVSLTDSINGFIKFKGQPLDKNARLFGEPMKNCPHNGRSSFRIRQPVHPSEAVLISEALKKSGNLFDFSELIVAAVIVGENPAKEPARLDLTRGMQNADLENKIIVLENEINQVRQESKEAIERERRNTALTKAIEGGAALYLELDEGRPIRDQRLARWRSDATNILSVNFGKDVAFKIFGSGNYTPPNTVPEQKQWLLDYLKTLGSLII